MTNACLERRFAPRYRISHSAARSGGPDLKTILTRAKLGVEGLKQGYLEKARYELAELSALVDQARRADATRQCQAIDRIFRISHDLRGTAGSFDYPLLTRLGSSLCGVIEKAGRIGPRELAVIDLHVGAMRAVLSNRTTGDGDVQARALIAGIDAVVSKRISKLAGR